MKAELIVIGCFLLLIGSSQSQPWAANTTPRRQISITQSQQRKGNTTQLQQQRPLIKKQASHQTKNPQTIQPQSSKIQSKQVQKKSPLSMLQVNKTRQSYNQYQFQPRTNQFQAKRTQNLGISKKQTSINFMKPNTNRLQQRQSPTRQTANLSQQSRRTQNKMQTNLNQRQILKPINQLTTSQFKTNQFRTNPIQQPRFQLKQPQRQRNLSLSQQKQAQTQRNRSPVKQMVNNVSQAHTRNKSQTGQTPISLSSQRKQKLPQQIQQQTIQNRQISPQIIKN
jgi:hypothetical protein